MAKQFSSHSLAFRVTMYFARNADEALTSSDIVEKFSVKLADVHGKLAGPVKDGMLDRASAGPGRGKVTTYSAGDKLLEMVGERRMLERRLAERCTSGRRLEVEISACTPVAAACLSVLGSE